METYYTQHSLNLSAASSARDRALDALKEICRDLVFIKKRSGYWSEDDNGHPADAKFFSFSMYHMIKDGVGAGMFLPIKGAGGEHAVFYAVSGATLTGEPTPSGEKMNFYYDEAGESGPLRAPILPASIGFLYSATDPIPIPQNTSGGNASFRIPRNTLICPIAGCGWNASETSQAGLIDSYQTPFSGFLRLGVSRGIIAAMFAPNYAGPGGSSGANADPQKLTVAGPICMPMPWNPDKTIRPAVAFIPGSRDPEDYTTMDPAWPGIIVDFPGSDGGLATFSRRHASMVNVSSYVAGPRVPWSGIYLASPVNTGDGTGLYGYVNPEVLRVCGVSASMGQAGQKLNAGRMVIPNTNSPANFSIMWESGYIW